MYICKCVHETVLIVTWQVSSAVIIPIQYTRVHACTCVYMYVHAWGKLKDIQGDHLYSHTHTMYNVQWSCTVHCVQYTWAANLSGYVYVDTASLFPTVTCCLMFTVCACKSLQPA